MDQSECWLDPRAAARLISEDRGQSIGAAQSTLRKAMASGKVQVIEDDGNGPRSLPSHLWTYAEFDFARNLVIAPDEWALERGLDKHREYRVQINADDLRYWLSRKHAPGGSQTQKLAEIAPKAHELLLGAKTIRRRGRAPKQFERVKEEMLVGIRSGLADRDPRQMLQKQWETIYGASRDTCRNALTAALSEIQAGNSDK